MVVHGINTDDICNDEAVSICKAMEILFQKLNEWEIERRNENPLYFSASGRLELYFAGTDQLRRCAHYLSDLLTFDQLETVF